MSRQLFDFPEPERFVVGTVGMPGERTFFLQARSGNSIVSVVIEKQQVAALADRVEPIFEEFRVGTLALGWDDDAEKVVVEAYAVADEDVPDLGEDDEEGVDTLRVRLTSDQARSFILRARTMVNSGRPACPFCGQPLDPSGHICPRANGFRRRP